MSAPTEGVLASKADVRSIVEPIVGRSQAWFVHFAVPAISVAEHERLVAEARAEERAAERERCAAIVRDERDRKLGIMHPHMALTRVLVRIEADR